MSSSTIYSELLQKVKRAGFPILTIERIHQLYIHCAISSVDVCRYCHALAQAGDEIWKLSAYESIVAKDTVLSQAAAAEEWRLSQQLLQNGSQANTPSLIGIPFSVKANIATASQPLTAGSRILGAYKQESNRSVEVPVNAVGYHADVTSVLLHDCHAVLIGTTTMDEFGMGSLGTHVVSRAHPPRNPIPLLSPRGSVHSNLGSAWTNTDVLHLIQLPQEAIDELHADLLNDRTEECAKEPDIYVPGGSSCGSAIAVSHGSSLFSLGSDTGGSIRLPATYCHVVGFKPSYGMLSRYGLVSYASSLDTIGIVASSVSGVAITFQNLVDGMAQQSHIRDSTQAIASKNFREDVQCVVSLYNMGTSESPSAESLASTGFPFSNSLEGMRIGIPAAFSVTECSPAVRQVWLQGAQWLQQHGATVEIVSEQQIVPETLQRSLSAYYILACSEASSNLSRYDGLRFVATTSGVHNNHHEQQLDDVSTSLLELQYAAARTEYFGNEVIRRMLCGTFALSSDRFHTHYETAAKLRSSLMQQFQNTLRCTSFSNDDDNDDMSSDKYDLLLIPTTIYPPPKAINVNVNPIQMFANDIMTVPISLVGYPAISISIRGSYWGGSDTHPPFQIGLQLVGPRQGECNVLWAAAVLEHLDCSMLQREVTPLEHNLQ
jgi:aspartyl-tRNA(Asn)/glutamyl-tRNA(Gln) amidotransferase subunit A